MALPDAIPTIVAQEMLRTLRRDLVYAMRTNSSWQVNAAVGDSIDIVPEPNVGIADYDPDSDDPIVYNKAIPGDKKTIALDQHKAFAVTLDDVRRRQAVPMLLEAGVRNGARNLRETIDAFVRDRMAADQDRDFPDIGAAGTKIDLGAALTEEHQRTIKNTFKAAVARFTMANVPMMGRWAIVGPAMKFALTTLFEQGMLDDAVMGDTLRNGFAGRLYGLNIYEASNPPGAANIEQTLFGNDYATAFALQIDQTETIRLESRFADGVRGLVTYGGTVIEPASIAAVNLHYEGIPDVS